MVPKEKPHRETLANPPGEQDSSAWQASLGKLTDVEPLEVLSTRQTRKRKRNWEKEHPGKLYRGVPAEVRERVKQIAETLEVTADEVARAFLEYGLQCVERGTLTLSGLPGRRRGRMTLYASGPAWAENGWTPTPPAKEGRRKKAPTWREVAHYRIPDELHEQVKRLAGDVYPVGEVAAVLLKNGIESYERGVLVLFPKPKTGPALSWSGGQK